VLSSASEVEKWWRYNLVESSVVGYSPDCNYVITDAEEYPSFEAFTNQRLVRYCRLENS
jgi:hypothetical protein